jgi:DinB superfamily
MSGPDRPGGGEHAPFYAGYVSLVTESDVLAALEAQARELEALAASVPAERESFRYAPGKWSVRQVLGHLTDAERVFGYRAFCISRGDRTPLPGFDENAYVASAPFDGQSLKELARDFAALRGANLAVFRHLDPARWALLGSANGSPVSPRALAFIMAGHVRHHQGVLRERYGVPGAA